MLFRRITDYVLQSRLRAMGTAFICAFVPILGTVSILIAGLVTLRKGVQEGALVVVAATLPVLISLASVSTDTSADLSISPIDAAVVVVSFNVLTWLYAVLLRRFASWSLVLQFASLVSVLTVLAVHSAYPDIQAWWQQWLTSYFGHIEQAMGDMTPEQVKASHDMMSNMVTGTAPYATGLVTMAVSFYALLLLLLARWWQSALFNPGGLQRELLTIRLSYAAGVVLIAGVIASFVSGAWVPDAMLTVYLAFGLAGLSLLHYVWKTTQTNWIWIALIYIGMTIAPMTMLLLALIALLDIGVDFRKRL